MSAALLPQLVPLVLALIAAGLVAGVLAGLLGVGGGIVIVPALFTALTVLGYDPGVAMHMAVGTSLATIIPTSLVSSRSHWRRGAVDLALVRAWAPSVILGVVVGSFVAGFLRGQTLTLVFAVMALMIAANLAFRHDQAHAGERRPRAWILHGIGLVIGFLSALMGIGGGSISVPAMSAFGYPIRRAVGTSAAIGALIAVPGALGFALVGAGVAGRPPLSLGYVNPLGLLAITPMTMLAAPWGARLAHAIPPLLLRRAFALFLTLVALKMLWSLYGPG